MGKKSELRQLRIYTNLNYSGKFFPEISESRNHVGTEKFFGQKPNYVFIQLRKRQNHPFVLPLVPQRPQFLTKNFDLNFLPQFFN